MINNYIPPSMIVNTASRRNKDYELEFINSDRNSDVYTLRVYLRNRKQDEKNEYIIRLILICDILSYPALEMTWDFKEEEFELASRVYHRICDEVDDVKTHFDRSMAPASILGAQIREAVKPISLSHQQIDNNVALDEAKRLGGVSDWRMSLYSGRYPHTSKEEIQKFKGNENIDVPHYKE